MKKVIKKNYKFILGIVIGLIWSSGIAYAATILFDSDEVSYDNTTSGLSATNVQSALDELYVESTSYQLFEARVSALENKTDDYIIVRGTKGTINKAYGNMATLTATTVSGYTFLTWSYCHTSGWVASIYPGSPASSTSTIWNATSAGLSGTGDFYCYALYIKS